MKSFNATEKTFLRIGLILMLSLFIGCSGVDVFDEQGGRYTFDLEILDADETGKEIDLTQDPDCNDDGTADDPELWTQVNGVITVSVASDAPGLELLGYNVHYHPVPSLDDTGAYVDPPDIPSQQRQRASMFVDSGGTLTDTVILMTFDTKNYVVNNFPLSLFSALYTIEVEVIYETYEGNEETYHFYEDVTMSFFDRC